MAIAANDWTGLLWLWIGCGFAYLWVRYERGLLTLPNFRFWKRKPKLRVLPDLEPEARKAPTTTPPDASMAEIDALLDKIAQSGLSSLTAKERAKLEQGRENLRRKGAGRG